MHLMDFLRLHTGKLTGTWFVGVLTWVVEATNFIGLIGAFVGCIAGIMLVVIRWDDFWDSKPMKRLRSWF